MDVIGVGAGTYELEHLEVVEGIAVVDLRGRNVESGRIVQRPRAVERA